MSDITWLRFIYNNVAYWIAEYPDNIYALRIDRNIILYNHVNLVNKIQK